MLKPLVRKILPDRARRFLKVLIYPESAFLTRLEALAEESSIRSKNDLILSTTGEVFCRSPYGIEYWVDTHRTVPIIHSGEQGEFDLIISYVAEFAKKTSHRFAILDVGANIGLYSCTLAARIPNVSIHSFEPVTSSFLTLKKNVTRNHLEGQIHALNYAVSSADSDLIIKSDNLGPKNHILMGEQPSNIPSQKVRAITLDGYCRDNKIEMVDFIKVDVEGFELEVLKGALSILKACRPVLLLEIAQDYASRYKYQAGDIFKLLSEIGYETTGINSETRKYFPVKTYSQALNQGSNFLFTTPGKHPSPLHKGTISS